MSKNKKAFMVYEENKFLLNFYRLSDLINYLVSVHFNDCKNDDEKIKKADDLFKIIKQEKIQKLNDADHESKEEIDSQKEDDSILNENVFNKDETINSNTSIEKVCCTDDQQKKIENKDDIKVNKLGKDLEDNSELKEEDSEDDPFKFF